MLCRAAIIGVKYGFYGEDQIKIIQKFRLSPKFVRFNLIASIINEKEPATILKKFDELLEYLEINEELFVIEISK